jgi:hypothetical protein
MTNTCLLEQILKETGFKLVHDGQANPGQFNLPAEEIITFTRKYRLQLDGLWQNTWVTFHYDERRKFLGVPLWDFEIYSKEPDTKGREKMLLNISEKEKDKEKVE